MRDIVGKAGVRLALVTYHFGTKEALFEEVVRRRWGVLDQNRRTALAAVSLHKNATIEMLLEAFMEPYLRMMLNGDPGWNNYGRMIARSNHSNRWLTISSRYFDDTVRLFINELCKIVPRTPRLTLIRAFFLSVALMTHTFSQNRRIEHLSNGKIRADDYDKAYEDLIAYAAGGIRSLAASASLTLGKQARRHLTKVRRSS